MSTEVQIAKEELYHQVEERRHFSVESEKNRCLSLRAFNIFIASSALFRQYGSGQIIFLYGTSSAGKTSVCREFKAIRPEMVIDGIDAAMDRHYLKIISNVDTFKKHFFERYLILRKSLEEKDIPAFLAGRGVEYKQSCSEEERRNAKDAASYVSIIEDLFFSAFHRDVAQHNLFERAFSLSARGKNVVIDTVDSSDFLSYKVSKFFHCPLLVTLVHCSFVKLSEHKNERRRLEMQTEQKSEKHYGRLSFLQFTDLFKPRTNNDEPSMHSVDKATVTRIYDAHLAEELKFRPVPGIDEEDVQERRAFELDILLSKLGLEKSDDVEVELTPKGYFDLQIDTGRFSPRQCAKKIPYVFT